jgi:serine/threonine-protein kinase
MATKTSPRTAAGGEQQNGSAASLKVAPPPPAMPTTATAHSSESGRTYQLDRLIGKGGFGEVYLATPAPLDGLPAQVCVKISESLTPWVREAYFAQLLEKEPRALRVYDRFVEPEGSRMRYCLAMEYAEHGDLGAWLGREGAQSERFVRREIAAILKPLDILHRGQALHRDLTPFNVFVCAGQQLKLGDVGIATHQLSRRGVTADAFNLFNVPSEIAWGKIRKWQQRDDIFQVGLLAAMLLRGDVARPVSSRDVRGLPCSDHLKEVIHCCLGARGKRYQSAAELIAALHVRPKEPRKGRIDSLDGRSVSFTGILGRPRTDAVKAAKKAGATVQSKPGKSTDVLVRGRPNPLQIAGKDGGTKLIEIRRLAAKGHRITVIGERQFWKLVDGAAKARKGARRAERGRRYDGSASGRRVHSVRGLRLDARANGTVGACGAQRQSGSRRHVRERRAHASPRGARGAVVSGSGLGSRSGPARLRGGREGTRRAGAAPPRAGGDHHSRHGAEHPR